MAYLPDVTEEELQRQQLGASAPSAGAGPSTPGTATAPASASSGTGFAPLAAYFGANVGKAGEMANTLAGGLEQKSAAAIASGDVGAAQALQPQLEAAASNPGRASLFQASAGPGYTAGMGGLDAYLAGAAQPERFAGLKFHWGGGLNEVGMPSPSDTRYVPVDEPTTPAPPRERYPPTAPTWDEMFRQRPRRGR